MYQSLTPQLRAALDELGVCLDVAVNEVSLGRARDGQLATFYSLVYWTLANRNAIDATATQPPGPLANSPGHGAAPQAGGTEPHPAYGL